MTDQIGCPHGQELDTCAYCLHKTWQDVKRTQEQGRPAGWATALPTPEQATQHQSTSTRSRSGRTLTIVRRYGAMFTKGAIRASRPGGVVPDDVVVALLDARQMRAGVSAIDVTRAANLYERYGLEPLIGSDRQAFPQVFEIERADQGADTQDIIACCARQDSLTSWGDGVTPEQQAAQRAFKVDTSEAGRMAWPMRTDVPRGRARQSEGGRSTSERYGPLVAGTPGIWTTIRRYTWSTLPGHAPTPWTVHLVRDHRGIPVVSRHLVATVGTGMHPTDANHATHVFRAHRLIERGALVETARKTARTIDAVKVTAPEQLAPMVAMLTPGKRVTFRSDTYAGSVTMSEGGRYNVRGKPLTSDSERPIDLRSARTIARVVRALQPII